MTALHRACAGVTRSKWFLPLLAAALGGLILVAFWAGGHLVDGLGSFAVMAGFGLLVLLGGRSETIRGLRGDGRDERFARMYLTATAVAGMVLILVVIVSWLVEIARGRNGNPFGWLGAIAGLAYVAAIVVQRWRS